MRSKLVSVVVCLMVVLMASFAMAAGVTFTQSQTGSVIQGQAGSGFNAQGYLNTASQGYVGKFDVASGSTNTVKGNNGNHYGNDKKGNGNNGNGNNGNSGKKFDTSSATVIAEGCQFKAIAGIQFGGKLQLQSGSYNDVQTVTLNTIK